MRKPVTAVILCVLVAALMISAGCGKKAEKTTPTTTGNEVRIANFAFSPDTITVKAGTKVTWTNEDSTVHTVSATDFESGEIKPGQSYSRTFSTPGTYDYRCSIHPSMTGKVIVTGGGSSSGTP